MSIPANMKVNKLSPVEWIKLEYYCLYKVYAETFHCFARYSFAHFLTKCSVSHGHCLLHLATNPAISNQVSCKCSSQHDFGSKFRYCGRKLVGGRVRKYPFYTRQVCWEASNLIEENILKRTLSCELQNTSKPIQLSWLTQCFCAFRNEWNGTHDTSTAMTKNLSSLKHKLRLLDTN